MIEIIAITILLSSFLGMAIIFFRKIPDLKILEVSEKAESNFFSISRQKIYEAKNAALIKSKKFFVIDFWEVFLQKVVSKVRVFSLKLETKCSHLLEKTRERSKREKESKKYWEKMTRIVKKKKGK